ncbi:MAG TPA: hypothetical protein VHP11_13445, partial [Tepidisphaeraceae bacterium]|nr:hypothetical protein [Tepidisphaeraceae bacterium]
QVAIAAGMLLYLLYILRIGGDFMRGRYLAAPLLCSVILLASLPLRGKFAIAACYTGIVLAAVLGLLTPFPPLLATSRYKPAPHELIDRGIADERGYYYIYTGLLRSDPHASNPRARDALDLRRHGSAAIVTSDSIGVFGYHAGPSIHIVDPYALTDPLLARLPVKPTFQWRIGHFQRELPAGYVETLDSDHNQIQDPRIHNLYEDLVLITRGPLFTAARWKAIWRVNTGG